MARVSYLATAMLVWGLVVVGTAFGADGSTTVQGYAGVAGQTQGQISQAVGGNTNATLPFTGLNIGLMAAAGVVLLLAGAVLRRRGSES